MVRPSARGPRPAAMNFDVPLLDGDHVTDDAGTGFVHTAPSHGPTTTRHLDGPSANCCAIGIDTAIPFTVDADGFYTKDAAGLRRASASSPTRARRAMPTTRHRGADRERGQCCSPAAAQAPVSAFLALEEADHLPQHAAMVHLHGQARPRRLAAREGAEGHRRTRKLLAAAGQNRLRGMIETARLGALAPARLGRADRRLRRQGDEARS
jgi:hypothetical protein